MSTQPLAPGQLTSYREGSIQELWAISFPLILSVLSVNLMYFLDRLILARYDIHAMNAAVVAGLVFSIFQYGAIGIASISEVFVGQYNGAKKISRMGEPVWQTIWFSIFTTFLFIPLAIFAGPFLIPNPEYQAQGIPFFKTLMAFGPTFPLVASLSSFFVGRGQVKLVMVTTILSNILNVSLDFLLIFGVSGFLPALGATGAALATGIAQAVQAVVLLVIFLKRSHREIYGTDLWQFNARLFWQSLQLGIPNSISSIVELSAWSVLALLLASVSDMHLTVFSIGESFFTLFAFGFWGLQKGITTVSANYFGAHHDERVTETLASGIKIVLFIMLIFTIPMFVFPELLVSQFLNPQESSLHNAELQNYLVIAMRWLWVYFLLDGIAWLISGVLTAAGDTKFVMILNSISAWAFSVVPTYLVVSYLDGSPVITWILSAGYGLLNSLSFYLRYRKTRGSYMALYAT